MKLGIEEQQRQTALHDKTDDQKYSKYLVEMKGHFLEAERLYNEQDKSLIGQLTDIKNAIQNGGSIFKDDERWKQALNKALNLKQKADGLHKDVVNSFENDVKLFTNAKLPKSFLKQHSDDVALLKDRYEQFNSQVKLVTSAKDEDTQLSALKDLNQLLGQWQFGRKHQYEDTEQLGNFTPKSAKNTPLLLSKADAFRAGIESNPQIQLAALGDFDFSKLPGADDPAYLAETDEIVLTQVIKDKAEELEYKPVNIHNWVRNNIDYLPGWGAYQTAQLTMEAKRGNAMDIASLEIALLRASGIPARYVLGVAEIPAEQYTNWLGNFKNADVASTYASMNGIATQMVTGGGKITKIRTQHIWVEAAIDYFPSRGVKNRSADSWFPMDASFKQYEYQEGLDVVAIGEIDAEALANQFVDSGTVDETAGFVQNLDPTELLNAQEIAQSKLQAHIDNELTDPTVGEVIGGRTIKVFEPTTLAGSPYRKHSRVASYGKLPSNLQHRVGLGFGDDRTIMPMAKINNQKITLSFKPATANDEQALESLLPAGEITDINQLPSFIPSTISVIPELALNGEVFKTGNTLRIGNEVDMSYQVLSPIATYAPYKYSVIAGSYLNIPVMGQVVSPTLIERLQTNIEATQSIADGGDTTQTNTLNREALLGDMFYAGSLGYFAQYNGLSHIASLQSNGTHKLDVGYGSYGYEPELNTFFGIPRGINTGGAAFNIRVGRSVQSFDGNKETKNNLRFQAGLISSTLENAVPEQMYSDVDNPTDGVSAVKALQLAGQHGQRIYQIDQNNVNTALNNLGLDSNIETEIRNAVTQGRIAIAHTNNINVPGWSGAGYLILDPEIMDGSYKISGGANGGFKKGKDNSTGGLLGALLALLVPPAEASDGAPTKTAFDFLLSLLDFFLETKFLGPISLILGALENIGKITEACEGLGQALNLGLLAIFTVSPAMVFALAATGIGAFIYFFLLSTFLALVINEIVATSIAVNCKNDDEQ